MVEGGFLSRRSVKMLRRTHPYPSSLEGKTEIETRQSPTADSLLVESIHRRERKTAFNPTCAMFAFDAGLKEPLRVGIRARQSRREKGYIILGGCGRRKLSLQG